LEKGGGFAFLAKTEGLMRLVPGRISGDGEKGSKSGDFAQRRLVPGLISGDNEKGSKSGDFTQRIEWL